MTCCPSDEHLARLLEESLDRDELATVEKHLEACAPCQEALEELTRERFSYSSTWRPWAEQPPGETPVAGSSLSSFDGLGSAFDRDYRRPSSLIGHPPTLPSADVTGDDWPDVDGYQILGRLGHGGMGVVYRARQRGLDRLVALKMIRGGGHAGPEQLTRFRIEVRSVARLRHPNVVQVYDVGEADGLPFVTLELLEGGSLEARVAGTPQPERASAELVAKLARAIAAAHRAGVIHRDLKPANVLFAADGTPKITDFGLAKRLDEEDGQTHSGQVMGSPSFMAPEQALGQGRVVGPAADIYSLGAILYEMLTGRPPFKGASPMETLFQVVHDEPAPPSKLRSVLSRDLETICLKCLAKQPGRRYLDADALADDLARFMDGSPILGRRVGPGERTVRWARRQPASAALAVLGMAAVVASLFAYNQARENIANLRIEGSGVLAEGRVALANRRWPDGKSAVEPFLAKVRVEPALADLRSDAEGLLKRLDDGQSAQAREDDARKRLVIFFGLRRKALIRDAQAAGAVLPVNVRATRDAVRAALAVFPTTDPVPESIGSADRVTIDQGRCELLLILAEAVARPVDGEKARTQADEALRVLEQASKLGPPTWAFHQLRASCLASFGDEAGAGLERAMAEESAATDALGHVLKGQELSRRQRWVAAIAEFEDALRLEPQQFRAQLLLAVCHLHAGKYAEARAGLTACLQAEPDSAVIYRLRGFAQGEQAYHDARAKRAREAGPVGPESEGPFEAAEADFRKGLTLVGPEDDERYNLLVGRSILRIRFHRLEEAVQDLQAAIKLRPESAMAMIPLGQAYQKQGRIDEAIEQFTLGLRLKPDLPALYRSRALARLDRGKPSPEAIDQAMSDLSRAIQLEAPASIDGANDRARRARLLTVLGRFDEALADCDATLKVAPDNADALLIRVKSLLELKRYPDVVEACDASIGRGRASAELFDLRGSARAKRDDYSGAIQDYTQALVLDPIRASSMIHRGWAYVVSEAPKLALHDFEEAIKLTPNDPEAYNGRGFAYVLQGQVRLGVADADASLWRGGEPDARTTYNAARIFAKAAAVVSAGKATDIPRRTSSQIQIADDYQDRAQVLIRLALERLPQARRAEFWRDVVQGDPALAAIRQRPKFSQLAGQFGRQAQ